MAAVVGATTPRILFAPRRSIVLFGDSRVANAGSFDATNQKTTALDWFTYGQALVPGGPVYDMVANKGIGGNTTTQMAARFATDVLALTPDAVVIWGGTNDTWSTTSDVDVTVSRMTAMIDRARLAGIYVYVVGDTVCSTKGSGFNKLMMYYNDVLRQYGFANRGVEFWDFNSQIIDPASTSGNPLANVTIDGLHVSAAGAYLCGKNVIAPSLAKLPSRGASLTSSIVDNYANNGNSRNLFSKGYMQGAGGTAGTGNSGTLPTGWSGSRSGTGSGVFSVNARADGFGNDVRTVATFGAANDNVSLIAILDTNPTLAGTYVLEAALTVSGATNLNRCDLYGQITVNNGSNVSYNFGCLTQNQSTLLFPSAMGPLILRSPPMTLPAAGTVVSHNVQLVMTGNGAAGRRSISGGRRCGGSGSAGACHRRIRRPVPTRSSALQLMIDPGAGHHHPAVHAFDLVGDRLAAAKGERAVLDLVTDELALIRERPAILVAGNRRAAVVADLAENVGLDVGGRHRLRPKGA